MRQEWGCETWLQAKVDALGELLHRTWICSSSARQRRVWETRRVSEWIPNALQVSLPLGAGLLLLGEESHHSEMPEWKARICPWPGQWRRHEMGTCRAPDAVPMLAQVTPNDPLPGQREGGYVHGADEKTEDQGMGFVLRLFSSKTPVI